MSFQCNVASTVKLNVPSTPSVIVRRHHHKSTKHVNHRNRHNVKSSVHTNDILKNGGTLPCVLPKDIDREEEQPSLRTSCDRHNANARKKGTIQSSNATKGKRPVQDKAKEQEEQCCLSKDPFKAQFEEETEKRVMYDLEREKSPCVEFTERSPQVDSDCRNFPIDLYVALVTEMNESIYLEPYNPTEFSEEHESISLKQEKARNAGLMQNPSSVKTDNTRQQSKRDVLEAIHNELLEWKKGTTA